MSHPGPAAQPWLAVDCRQVTARLGGTAVLDRVDLTVPAGAVHGLVGPNGAGKTTLLSLLFGLLVPDEGDVRLFGRTRREAGADWLDGVGGFVETPAFYPYLSGQANLAVLARLDGAGSAPVAGLLEEVGLGGAAARQRVRGYSLGMRQRLGLAAALLRRPRLLILDEPTNGLDPVGVRDLRAAIRRLASGGMAVLLSSHDMAEVSELCDSVTVLHRGEVAFDGTLAQMRAASPDPTWRLVTSDDPAAVRLAGSCAGVEVSDDDAGGLRVVAERAALDAFMVALGRRDIAVRGLAAGRSPLEALFFRLTEPEARHAAQT